MVQRYEQQLIERLTRDGLVADADAQAVLEEAGRAKESVCAQLMRRGLVTEEILLPILAETLKVPFLRPQEHSVERAVVEKVPLKIAEYYRMVPLKIEKRKLTIAVSSPLDLRTQDDIRAHLGYEIEAVLARERDILEATRRFYGFGAQTLGQMIAQETDQPARAAEAPKPETEIENLEQAAGDASVAKLVNQIILEAYQKRASDIHIEPYRGKVKLRYRIDGTLYDAQARAEMNRFIQPILSRIKILSNLNIVEKRLPQDGRAIVKVEDATLDLRVSSIPTQYGESIVIRILPVNRVFDLGKLGMAPDEQKTFERLIEKPHGILFVTGPTGSGKSTSLYACLNRLNTDERKIITIEDPVEYEMEGVTQIQVAPAIGLDFARGLRSILRHDPDVIMVGEVRDLETAEIAIRVALTGHLVFSTLHTNDAASGATRLVDIGVEPYLIASSVEAFIAQRLVRVICPRCKEEDRGQASSVKERVARELGRASAAFPVFRGKGCDHCGKTGFAGRVAIYEILLLSDRIRELITQRATAGRIKQQAVSEGMRTLRQDGWRKVLEGMTTIEEILEITPADEEVAPAPAAGPGAPAGAPAPAFPPGSERRQFERVDHVLNVRYKVIKAPGPAGAAVSKPVERFTVTSNVSAGGLAFASRDPLGTGTILEIKLEIPDGQDALECLARVARSEPIEADKMHEIAACFLDLAASARSRIDRFVSSQKR